MNYLFIVGKPWRIDLRIDFEEPLSLSIEVLFYVIEFSYSYFPPESAVTDETPIASRDI